MWSLDSQPHQCKPSHNLSEYVQNVWKATTITANAQEKNWLGQHILLHIKMFVGM